MINVSYSLLSVWSTGDIDRAIALYLHLPYKVSKQIEDGRGFHDGWEKEIKEKGTATIGKTTYTFKSPKAEHTLEVPYNEKFGLKGRFDCLDTPTLYEFKTGVTNVFEYARSDQLPFYFLMCELADIEVERAKIIHFNQYRDKVESVIVYNTPDLREKARNFIDSIAPEIVSYFEEHGIVKE